MHDADPDARECPACAWKDDLIVELQHQVRELQHELETERLANQDWPRTRGSTPPAGAACSS